MWWVLVASLVMETKLEGRLAWLEGSLAQSITSFFLDTHPRKLIQFGLAREQDKQRYRKEKYSLHIVILLIYPSVG